MLSTMRIAPLQQPHQQLHHNNVVPSPSHSRIQSSVESPSSSRSNSKEIKSRRNPRTHPQSQQPAQPVLSSAASSSMKKKVKKPAEQPDPVTSSTPGLISLSKPIEEEKSTAAAKASRKSRAKASQPVVGHTNVLPASTHEGQESASGNHLSTSAPASSDVEQINQPEQALTWQQQLLGSSNITKSKSNAGKKSNSRSKTADASVKAEEVKDTPNWQQSLLTSTSRGKKGPKYDVFADSRDAETFGDGVPNGLRRSGSLGDEVARAKVLKKAVANRSTTLRGSEVVSSSSKGSNTAAVIPASNSVGDVSVDDVFNNYPQLALKKSRPATALTSKTAASFNPRNSLPVEPSTPVKRPQGHPSSSPAIIPSASAILSAPVSVGGGDPAYAGPDFHNSPSAASLPAPKFRNQKSSKTSLQLHPSFSEGRLSRGSVSSASSEEGVQEPVAGISPSLSTSLRDSTASATQPPLSSAAEDKPVDVHRGGETDSTPTGSTSNGGNTKSTTIENLLARLMG